MHSLREASVIWPVRPTVHGSGRGSVSDAPSWREPRVGASHRTCSYCGSVHPGDLLGLLDKGAVLVGCDWKYGWPHKFYVENVPDTRVGQMIPRGTKPIADRELFSWFARYCPYQEQQLALRAARTGVPPDPSLFLSAGGKALARALGGDAADLADPMVGRAYERLKHVASSPVLDETWSNSLTSDPWMAPATTVHVKWYNDHIQDEGYGNGALEALIEALGKHTSIHFTIDGERLRYTAPYPGYQRTRAG